MGLLPTEIRFPTDPAEIEAMGWTQMRLLAAGLTVSMTEEENVDGRTLGPTDLNGLRSG